MVGELVGHVGVLALRAGVSKAGGIDLEFATFSAKTCVFWL
jgi:hypothetical protein